MWGGLGAFFGKIFSSLLETFFKDREVKQLRQEKLEGKDEAIRFKSEEAKVMSAPSRSRRDTLKQLREHESED